MARYVTRGVLHQLVWRHQLGELESLLGVTRFEIAQACLKYQVPKPHGSYWQKVRVGQYVRAVSLRGDPTEEVYGVPPPAVTQSDLIDRRNRLARAKNPFAAVADLLEASPHEPGVLRLGTPQRPLVVLRSDSIDLAAIIYNAIESRLKTRGVTLRSGRGSPIQAVSAGRGLDVLLYDARLWESQIVGNRLSDPGGEPVIRVVLVGDGVVGERIWTFRPDQSTWPVRIDRLSNVIAVSLITAPATATVAAVRPTFDRDPTVVRPVQRKPVARPFQPATRCGPPIASASCVASGPSDHLQITKDDLHDLPSLIAEARGWHDAEMLRAYAGELESCARAMNRGGDAMHWLVQRLRQVADRVDPVLARMSADDIDEKNSGRGSSAAVEDGASAGCPT